MVVKACSDWKSYVTLLKCSNWHGTSLDVSIRERHHVTSWLSPIWDPESRMWMGCVLHFSSVPNGVVRHLMCVFVKDIM
jgi:hypothetical protein